MSSLVLLGSLGTLLSAVTMIPHLTHALRTRRPAGSTLAWAGGAVCSTVWFLYGVAGRDLLVAAPGLVTIPTGVLLATWTHRARTANDAAVSSMVVVPAWEPSLEALEGYRAGDTLELPRIVA